jgi:signal transduction histidine kinase
VTVPAPTLPALHPWLLAVAVALAILLTEQIIEQLAWSRALERERIGVLTDLSALRARLEEVIHANLLLVHGMSAIIAAEPQIDQEHFGLIARELLARGKALRSISGAPDLVISLLYPTGDTEAVTGLTLRDHPVQGPAVARAILSGAPTLAGPLPLVEGGIGVIIREPVFTLPTAPDDETRPWGIVSAVLDLDRLYCLAGVPDVLSRLHLTLRGTDGTGADGPVFFGDPGMMAEGPVTLTITVPGGTWQAAATPAAGWGGTYTVHWPLRALGLLVALAIATLTFLLMRGRYALALSEGQLRSVNAELEQRVAARTADLAATNKELEAFTYLVSHDLKAPLRAIDGYSRLLWVDHAERLDEEGRLFLDNVRKGVEQMSQLIEDLLDYSRMERRGLRDQPIDLGELTARLLKEREADLQASGAQVHTEVTGLVARADPEGLALVLRNLLDNALKFHRPGEPPVVVIQGRESPERIELAVSDQGIGFDMQFHDRIFEIFQRLQSAREYPGTGIGLASARKAMTRMGGQIHAESVPGAGATFYLELPS